MQSNNNNNLLNLKGVKIKNVVQADSYVSIYLETKPVVQVCPACNKQTSRIHDYRMQKVKDLPLQLKNTYLFLHKRRYMCKCGKKFYEKYDFLPKYSRMTNRLAFQICNLLSETISMKNVSKFCNVSTSTVSRIFDNVSYSRSKLPEVLCIDEFKGNAGHIKYQCTLVDGRKNSIVDVLPDRKMSVLTNYFSRISRHERNNVKYFVCDMSGNFADIGRTFFPNAKVLIDKYHFIRQVTWAVEAVRKRVQSTMIPTLRKYFKRSRDLILKKYSSLNTEDKQALDLMLLYNEDLRLVHKFKEDFNKICSEKQYSVQRVDFKDWIFHAQNSKINELKKCSKTFQNWSKEILNAFKYGYTNGPTEGMNNKIKVLKRISYGVKNYERFRNRIIHCLR